MEEAIQRCDTEVIPHTYQICGMTFPLEFFFLVNLLHILKTHELAILRDAITDENIAIVDSFLSMTKRFGTVSPKATFNPDAMRYYNHVVFGFCRQLLKKEANSVLNVNNSLSSRRGPCIVIFCHLPTEFDIWPVLLQLTG